MLAHAIQQQACHPVRPEGRHAQFCGKVRIWQDFSGSGHPVIRAGWMIAVQRVLAVWLRRLVNWLVGQRGRGAEAAGWEGQGGVSAAIAHRVERVRSSTVTRSVGWRGPRQRREANPNQVRRELCPVGREGRWLWQLLGHLYCSLDRRQQLFRPNRFQ